jgi:hypothetical protein
MSIDAILYLRYTLDYVSVVWNPITSTDANKLECVQGSF